MKLAEILEEIKFDDDYTDLRLDVLEPLDLSDIEFDKSTLPDEDTYRNQSIKQMSLGYGIEEFEELIPKLDALIDTKKYGTNPSEVFANLVRKTYEHDLS